MDLQQPKSPVPTEWPQLALRALPEALGKKIESILTTYVDLGMCFESALVDAAALASPKMRELSARWQDFLDLSSRMTFADYEALPPLQKRDIVHKLLHNGSGQFNQARRFTEDRWNDLRASAPTDLQKRQEFQQKALGNLSGAYPKALELLKTLAGLAPTLAKHVLQVSQPLLTILQQLKSIVDSGRSEVEIGIALEAHALHRNNYMPETRHQATLNAWAKHADLFFMEAHTGTLSDTGVLELGKWLSRGDLAKLKPALTELVSQRAAFRQAEVSQRLHEDFIQRIDGLPPGSAPQLAAALVSGKVTKQVLANEFKQLNLLADRLALPKGILAPALVKALCDGMVRGPGIAERLCATYTYALARGAITSASGELDLLKAPADW